MQLQIVVALHTVGFSNTLMDRRQNVDPEDIICSPQNDLSMSSEFFNVAKIAIAISKSTVA